MWPFSLMFSSPALPLYFLWICVSSCSRQLLLRLQAFIENKHTVTYQTKVSMCWWNMLACVCVENGVVSNRRERSAWRAARYDWCLQYELMHMTASADRAHARDQYCQSLKLEQKHSLKLPKQDSVGEHCVLQLTSNILHLSSLCTADKLLLIHL